MSDVVTIFCGTFLMPPTDLAAMEFETLDWIQNAIETAQSPAKDTQARIDAAGLPETSGEPRFRP
jgi:hypothetical protein